MEIPASYLISKFNIYTGNAVHSRNHLNGSCPICKEGNSFKKKKRLYYFPDEKYLYCHNCARGWTPYFWLKEVTHMTFKEILDDVKDYTGEEIDLSDNNSFKETVFKIPDLPGECVNLKDPLQLEYYKDRPIVKTALNYCNSRRLFTAINAPKTFYVCVSDYTHKNRLIIPYFNAKGQIESYISRSLLAEDTHSKYLIKFNSQKPIFNLDKIDLSLPYIFILEGPIDAMFVPNGIAVSGLTLTDNQESILTTHYPLHSRIWILDNFKKEKEQVIKKIQEKLKNDETLFFYENEFAPFKDMNEYCVQKKSDSIEPDLILKSCFKGSQGLLKMVL